jgi:membrane protease YdiL (CAAX protease family)
MSGIFLVEISFGWVRVEGAFVSRLPDTPFWIALALPVVFFLCVGVYEELFSRGYQLLNMAEGLNYPFLGPRSAIVLAWVLSSSIFGVLHLGNPNATLLSAFNIALAGLLLGAGYILTGQLAIPIGLHITWNFFQGTVFGFPVSGLEPIGASFLSTEQSGPDLWTGGAFGPEAGLMDPIATLIGISLIALWIRLRQGRVSIHPPLAEPPKEVQGTGER